ncbi:MAG: SH3 domain-containing protein [Rhodocyclaceae bacterium]|nr:SH3 domain-containing protein [Rhodocyclaceae bacterium]
MDHRQALALLALAGITLPAGALDYRSITEAAVLFDAPSQKAKPLYVIAAGTPVEVVVSLDAWSKVRDMKGDLAWIERRQLSDRRMLQVRTGGAQVRSEASDSARLVFEAESDVLLEYLDAGPPGWVKVRHRDGETGFVKASQVWGF